MPKPNGSITLHVTCGCGSDMLAVIVSKHDKSSFFQNDTEILFICDGGKKCPYNGQFNLRVDTHDVLVQEHGIVKEL